MKLILEKTKRLNTLYQELSKALIDNDLEELDLIFYTYKGIFKDMEKRLRTLTGVKKEYTISEEERERRRENLKKYRYIKKS